MAGKTKEASVIRMESPPINTVSMTIHLQGTSPLIMHRWSEKAKKELIEPQLTTSRSRKKDVRNTEREAVETLYCIDADHEFETLKEVREYLDKGGRIGFPSTAFKQAAVVGTYRSGIDVKMTELKANLHIPDEFVVINGKVSIREDMVKIGGMTKVAYVRYRCQVTDWTADVAVSFNQDMLSPDLVVNMFRRGGFACGVGEWRLEKGGSFGAFDVTGVN